MDYTQVTVIGAVSLVLGVSGVVYALIVRRRRKAAIAGFGEQSRLFGELRAVFADIIDVLKRDNADAGRRIPLFLAGGLQCLMIASLCLPVIAEEIKNTTGTRESHRALEAFPANWAVIETAVIAPPIAIWFSVECLLAVLLAARARGLLRHSSLSNVSVYDRGTIGSMARLRSHAQRIGLHAFACALPCVAFAALVWSYLAR